eukprot:3503494-Amphidinium_carterae.1
MASTDLYCLTLHRFRGATVQELKARPKSSAELNNLVDYVLQWAGLTELEVSALTGQVEEVWRPM